MGVREIDRSLEQWQMGVKDLRRRMILAPTPRERERWYAILLLVQGLTAAATAEALERGTLGVGLRRGRACGPDIRADRWFPPALDQTQQEELKGAVEQPPATAGIVMANWYWKVVRQFVSERFGISLSRSSCLNWLHRLGFAFKRPKKRLLKADESKRETFVAEYAVLWEEAQRTGARIFFADEAHFRADAEAGGQTHPGPLEPPKPGNLWLQERVDKFLAGLAGRGETALPWQYTPPRFPTPGKCTSHLGFGLGIDVETRFY